MNKVSVIITTYGRPLYLKRAIKSVINQTYKEIQLIIVDDNNPNTDDRKITEQIVSGFKENNLTYIKHSRNMNGAAARNSGLAVATGEYITFLDDDDTFDKDRLSTCVDVLGECTQNSVGGVYTGCRFFHNEESYRNCVEAESGNFLTETLATTFKSHSGSNLFFKTKIVRELGGFDEKFIRHQDYEFLVRFFQKYNLIGIPRLLMTKYEYGTNVPNFRKMISVKRRYLSKYKEIINSLNTDERNFIYYSNYIALTKIAVSEKNHMWKRLLKISMQYKIPSFKDCLHLLYYFITNL